MLSVPGTKVQFVIKLVVDNSLVYISYTDMMAKRSLELFEKMEKY